MYDTLPTLLLDKQAALREFHKEQKLYLKYKSQGRLTLALRHKAAALLALATYEDFTAGQGY